MRSVRLAVTLVVAALVAGCGTALPSADPSSAIAAATPSAPVPTRPPVEGFVTRAGGQLSVGGRPFRFVGLDIPQATGAACWPHLGTLEQALVAIGPGQNTFRAFVFQRTATTAGGERDWTVIDQMLAIARQYGERVIMVLADEWHGQQCSDLPVDKSLDWYQSGYRTQIEGATTYRDWVRQIVMRYRDDPVVAAWQLVNEARAPRAGGSCDETAARTALRAFADDVGGLVKALDPHHLVSLGATSGKCGTDYGDYGYVTASPSIDLCDYHDYKPLSPLSDTDTRDGLVVSIRACTGLGKPLFVGEIGIGFRSIVPPTTQQRALLFDSKLGAQFAAGSVGELLWTWSQSFSDQPPRDMEITPGDPALALLAKS